MKKVTIMLSCMALLMFACTNEEDTATIEPIVAVSALAIDYNFNGETITVDFKEEASGDIVPVASEGLNRMQEISDQNPQLIYSPISKNEIDLYANEDELYSSLNIKKWNPENERGLAAESSSSSVTFLAQAVQKLTLYNDTYFLNPLLNLTDPCLTTSTSNSDYWLQKRLQNFNDPSAYNCNGNTIVYNDRVSSMIVAANSPQYAFRFFVDKNFGASSLWLHGGVQANGFQNLQQVCYGFLNARHWNNKISSAKVINVVTGQELNGIISTGGGGGSGYTDPGDGQGDGGIGDYPEITNN